MSYKGVAKHFEPNGGVCFCGSKLPRHALRDARGIFCAYVCDKCEADQRAKYRDDIFTDQNYPADEPIEPE